LLSIACIAIRFWEIPVEQLQDHTCTIHIFITMLVLTLFIVGCGPFLARLAGDGGTLLAEVGLVVDTVPAIIICRSRVTVHRL